MHILLPPSEGKSAPDAGPALDLESLSLPALTATRGRVLDALVRLARGPEDRARAALGISARQVDELERDRTLSEQPCAAARNVYAGVLYEALGLASLPPAARRRADRMLLISSGLFGAVGPADRIPAYRLSGDTDLPGIGPLAAAWRSPMETAMSSALARGPILDLRSGAYAAHWSPTGAFAARTATVRVLQERRVGRTVERVVVSHHNKATKGRLVRALLESGASPRTLDALVDACHDVGFTLTDQRVDRSGVTCFDLVVAHL